MVKLGTVTASYMVMHRVLITLTLTFVQGRIHQHDENNKCSIISETIQALPIQFAVKIVRFQIDMTIAVR